MEFVNPSLIAFASGGLIPIIIHLLHRQRFRRIRWGAMQFLLNAIKKTQRRIRLENLLLLLIRILIMVLLAFAIARPLVKSHAWALPFDSNTNYIFVMDVSYSMAYKRAQATALELAKRRAREMLEKIQFSSEDTFTLILLSDYPEIPLKSAKKKETALEAIEEIELTDYGTSMPRTFALIEDRIRYSGNVDKRIYLFTDMQRTAWETGNEAELIRFQKQLERLSKDDRIRFFFIDVGEENAVNAAIVGIETSDRVPTVKARTSFIAHLYNFSDIPLERMTVSMLVNGVNKAERIVSVDPRSLAQVTFEHEFLEAGPYRIRFSIDPDFLSKDDSRYLALDVKDAVRILLVDGNPGSGLDSGTKFVQLALDPLGEGRMFQVDVKTSDTLPIEELDRYEAVFWADVQFLSPEKLERIRDYVRSGGGLFIALGPRVDREFYNKELWEEGQGLLPAKLTEIRGVEREKIEAGRETPFHLHRIRLEHPLWRTFRDEKLAEMLGQIEFGQYWGLEGYEAGSVLASFQGPIDTPAFLEKRFGEGRVILYGSTLNKEWTLFPTRNPYLPVMIDAARFLASRPLSNRNLHIGDSIHHSLPVSQWAPDFRLDHVDPTVAGSRTVSAEKPSPGQRRVSIHYPAPAARDEDPVKEQDPEGRLPTETELRNEGIRFAGHYRLEYPEPNRPPLAYFAVNLGSRSSDADALTRSESNLERTSPEELRRRYPGFKFEMLFHGKSDREAAVAPPASSLWRFILFAVLALLLTESVLACVFGRRKE